MATIWKGSDEATEGRNKEILGKFERKSSMRRRIAWRTVFFEGPPYPFVLFSRSEADI